MSVDMGLCPLCGPQKGNNACPICSGSAECAIVMGGIPIHVPDRKHSESNPMARFRNGKHTRSAAIKAMCAHCMGCTYDEIEPGFRTLIKECTSYGCPLHEFRPFQPHSTEDAGDDA